ncbi:GMC family oxidoreductase [Pseudomonas monteilii]|uniref:Choline dehydrogenase n=1 Tax=Pseudomonas monteilii TaxID=76759 RepID=A0AAP7KIA0_9PSED|nr:MULTISPECIES: GMC family oxidoreductase N-terminal domain-containing protein [Pseudomonas]MCV4076473.1 GMC family oxidoreductase N-terminal domain-containing protein [Pseudomonas aeruginosa]OAH57068.1 choline dehydrogenase [Pseudomonas monteilii]
MSTFDYVIVGGGTAGCILANRLTASGKHTVLVLEAGGEPNGFWIPIPAGFTKLLVDKRYNWRFKTQAEANTRGREISVPRGKGLGGSTLINGMIYVRGQPGDYDAWESTGAKQWNFATLKPYFKKFETYAQGDESRGHDGPMHIQQVKERYPISDAFLEATVQDGHLHNEDYNGDDQTGFGYYQVAQYKGRRWSVVDGYLKPARARANLHIETNAHVLRLELEGSRCTGITYRQGGREITVSARHDVILCAGAIQSPQILELSGIGRADVLGEAGIPLKHRLDGVGENYIDHFATRMNWRLKNTVTLNELARGWRLGLAVAEYFTKRSGILTLGTGLVHGFVKTKPEMPTPDVQYFVVHASYANAAERILDKHPGFTIGVSQLRPKSQGSIHIQSKNPDVMPAIRPNFLTEDEDCTSLIEGMKIARRIMEQPAMSAFVEEETSPGAQIKSDEDWLEFARDNGQTIYHPIGTCRMGEDEGAVVDSQLRVHGLSGLRVVDASVIPSMISGNIQGAVMAVAERGADLILGSAPVHY